LACPIYSAFSLLAHNGAGYFEEGINMFGRSNISESWKIQRAVFDAVNHLTPRAINRFKLMGLTVKAANDTAIWAENTYIQSHGIADIHFMDFRYDMDELKMKNRNVTVIHTGYLARK